MRLMIGAIDLYTLGGIEIMRVPPLRHIGGCFAYGLARSPRGASAKRTEGEGMTETMFAVAKRMQAIVVQEWSNPPDFALAEIETPTPARGEVLVRVDTAAISFGDTLLATGRYQIRPILPFVPGSECSGIVVALGAGVTGLAVGDRVAARGFLGDARVDRKIVGSLAQYTALPAEAVLVVPDSVPLEQAALFRANAETSAYALRKGALAAGETLLVLGAGGGTGYAAVQLGKRRGARVLASASSEDKRAIALAAGADAAVDSRDPEWRAKVDAFAGGRGIDMVYDPLGGAQTERAFRTLGWNGRHLVIGFAAGQIPALPTNLPLLKGASLVGANVLQAMKYEPAACLEEAQALMAMFGRGELSVPPVTRRYGLEDAAQAYADVAGGQVAGRVVIKLAGGE